MSVKEKLRRLVDLLDDDEEDLDAALDYLRWLASDEPETLSEEEWEDVRRGVAEIARAEYVTLEEPRRDLGL